MGAPYALVAVVAILLACEVPAPPAVAPVPDAAAPIVDAEATPTAPPLALLTASPFADPAAPAALQVAQAHRDAGRPALALGPFEAFVADAAPHALRPAARLVLADLLDRAGRSAEAAAAFATAAEESPQVADFARYRAARSAEAAGQLAQVIDQAARVSPTSRYARLARDLRASALLGRGEAGTAVELMAAALAEAPPGDDLRAWLRYADALLAARQIPAAITALRTVALRHAGTAGGDDAERRLARLRWQVPAAEWRRRTAPAPDDVLLRGRALLEAHAAEALEALMLASLQSGDPQPDTAAWCETWWLLARARTRQRHHADAAAAYERVAEDCPDTDEAPDALYALARAAYTDDAHDLALDALERLRLRYPDHRLAGDSLAIAARIHRDLGEVDAARDRLLCLLHDHPEDDTAVEALWGLFQDDPAQVADVDPAEVEREPDVRGRLHFFQGLDHAAAGRRAAAASAYEAAVRQGPMSFYAFLALDQLRALDPAGFPARVERLMARPPRRRPSRCSSGSRCETRGCGCCAWASPPTPGGPTARRAPGPGTGRATAAASRASSPTPAPKAPPGASWPARWPIWTTPGPRATSAAASTPCTRWSKPS
ncbi:MAG: tetratricopeptide repeat protein [bacterium]